MISLVLNPVVLCFLVWLIARGTADIDFGRMFFIALGVGLVGAILGLLVGGFLALLTWVPVLALLVFLRMKYCPLTLEQAGIVSVLYFVYQIGFAFFMQSLLT